MPCLGGTFPASSTSCPHPTPRNSNVNGTSGSRRTRSSSPVSRRAARSRWATLPSRSARHASPGLPSRWSRAMPPALVRPASRPTSCWPPAECRLDDLPGPVGHHGACHRGAMFRTRRRVFLPPLPATISACPGGAMFLRHSVGSGTRRAAWQRRQLRLNTAPRWQAAWWRGDALGGSVSGAEHRSTEARLRRGGAISVDRILRFP